MKSANGLIACLLISAWLCLGWADTWDAIQAAAGGVTSVQSTFVQKKFLPILRQPLVSHGILSYQSPDSLRWEYLAPIHSILLMHNGRVRRLVKEADGFREEANTGAGAMQVVMEQITRWLTGRFNEDPMFAARLQPGPVIVLTPKQAALAAILERIELHLDHQPGMIQRVLIFEAPDAYTELAFSGTILNHPIDPEVFQKIP